MLMTLSLRNLLRNPRRSIVTALTVAIGVAGLFALQGFNTGIMNQYRDNAIHIRYSHGQVNTTGYRDEVVEKPWERWVADAPATIAAIGAIDGVKTVMPRIQFSALLTNGSITLIGRGFGVDGPKEKSFFRKLTMVEGSPLGAHPEGIVLGEGLARSLRLKVGDRATVLGNTIHGSFNGFDFTVVGIYKSGSPEMDDTMFQIQLPKAQALLDTDRVESMLVGLDGVERWPQFERAVAESTKGLEATPFHVLDKVIYQNAVEFLERQFTVFRVIILFIIVLAIFNTASNAVLERVQEIGNLRANGESKGDVMRLLVMESFFLSLIGCALAIAGTVVLTRTLLSDGVWMPPGPGITIGIFVRFELTPEAAVSASALGILVTLAANAFAGLKVALLPISTALRSVG